MRLVVLKLGGSLLACAELPYRLRSVVRELASCRILIVVGGGAAAEAVREWSRLYALTEESADRIAVRSMSVTRALVMELLPEWGEVSSHDAAIRHWTENPLPLLLDVESHLRQAESAARAPLPHTWNVTSDSIAAWVAARWSADELVLLKSTDLKPNVTLDQAQRSELVDAHFPQIAAHVPRVSWCNLLDSAPRIQPWLECGDRVSS